MCDYSLHHVASRPAKVEDKLITTKFPATPTVGFTAVGEPNVAVCLLPGTELAFEQDIECEPALGILPRRRLSQRLARFRQVNTEQPCVHHDALELPDGQDRAGNAIVRGTARDRAAVASGAASCGCGKGGPATRTVRVTRRWSLVD